MKIILADDHVLFREALNHYFERSQQNVDVLQVDDFHGVIGALESGYMPDLIMLDYRMPGMHGLGSLKILREKWPDIHVVLLSGTAEKADVEKAIDLGARGYFPKTLPGKMMMVGVHKILQGDIFVPMDHNTNTVMASYHGDLSRGLSRHPQSRESLTPREREVLGYLMRGVSNKEIARALDLQVVTIKLHVRGICKKLGAKNRTQAALIAQQENLV
jgi:two-component system nitrate/nitrite response regulator NarL